MICKLKTAWWRKVRQTHVKTSYKTSGIWKSHFCSFGPSSLIHFSMHPRQAKVFPYYVSICKDGVVYKLHLSQYAPNLFLSYIPHTFSEHPSSPLSSILLILQLPHPHWKLNKLEGHLEECLPPPGWLVCILYSTDRLYLDSDLN